MANHIHESDLDLREWYAGMDDEARLMMPSFLSDSVVERFRSGENQSYGTPLPWQKVRGKWALRPGELTIWAGINGHGKSQVTGQVALDLAAQGERCCIASMEMQPATTLYRMTRQALGNYQPTKERIEWFHDATDGIVWLLDHRGTLEWQKAIGLGRYVHETAGVKHLFIDSLMKLGIATDDYNAQKQCVNELCAMAHDTGLHVHLVHHARKSGGEDHPLDKFSVKGAGEIMDLADNGVLVWRNKRKEREAREMSPDEKIMKQGDVLLDVCKQRDGEWEGKLPLFYNAHAMQFVEDVGPPIDYLNRFERRVAA